MLPRIEGEDAWAGHRRSIWNHMMNNPIEDFANWSTIQGTMFTGDLDMIDQMWELIKSSKRFPYYKLAMREKWIGNPPPSKIDQRTSANMIRMTYYAMVIEHFFHIEFEDVESVFEFGGGYGAFAYIARRLNFKGNYTLFDFPEMILLQQWYLETNGLYDFTFMSKMENVEVDLLFSVSALSEAHPDVRDEVFNHVSFNRIFIEFQPRWDGWDNLDYFTKYAKVNLEKWQILRSKTINHYYLIGRKNG